MRNAFRTRCALAAALSPLALTLPASAATLVMSTDKSTYDVGEIIHMTVTGDSQGAADIYVFGTVVYHPGRVSPDGGQTQNTLTSFGGLVYWQQGVLQVDQPPGTQDAFNQIGALQAFAVDQLLVATLSFTAQAPGVAAFSWLADGSPDTLHFFGLTNAPGASVTIVPEPDTAALIALGLAVLALRSRRE